MQPVTLPPQSVCGVVTSMSCPTSSLSPSVPVCPAAVWHVAAPALSNAPQNYIFYKVLNQIRTACTDGHYYVSGWNGEPSAERGRDPPGGNL